MKRYLAPLVLAAMLLCSCAAPQGGGAEESAGQRVDQPAAKTAAEAQAQAASPEALLFVDEAERANDYEAYLAMVDKLYRAGFYFNEYGLWRQAEFALSAAASAAGSLRLCAESVLFLKNEGDSLEALTAGRFHDWDSLARLSPVCPYPDYFEGLAYQMQGMSDKAEEYFTRALTFPTWPEAGWNFSYLKMLSVEELYAVRDSLLEAEALLYHEFTPSLAPIPRDTLNFSPEYLAARAQEELAAENAELAFAYAQTAVLADPFSGSPYALAAAVALALEDGESAAAYLNDGLLTDPAHEGLNVLLHAFEGGQS